MKQSHARSSSEFGLGQLHSNKACNAILFIGPYQTHGTFFANRNRNHKRHELCRREKGDPNPSDSML